MQKSTSSPSLDNEAEAPATVVQGSAARGEGAWSQSLPSWQDNGSSRWWVVAGAGLGALASLAVAAAVVVRFSGAEGPECDTADACNARAVALANAPDPTESDLTLAARLFQQGCSRGNAAACNNLGLAYQAGRGVPVDTELALASFQKACSVGLPEACNNEGAMQEHGVGVPVNLGDARRSYFKACRRGSALGCSNLGALYAEGRGVAADPNEAMRFFTEACNLGSAVGCSNLVETETESGTAGTVTR